MLRTPTTPEEFMAKAVEDVSQLNMGLQGENPTPPYHTGDTIRSAYVDGNGRQVHSWVKVGALSVDRVFFKEGM